MQQNRVYWSTLYSMQSGRVPLQLALPSTETGTCASPCRRLLPHCPAAFPAANTRLGPSGKTSSSAFTLCLCLYPSANGSAYMMIQCNDDNERADGVNRMTGTPGQTIKNGTDAEEISRENGRGLGAVGSMPALQAWESIRFIASGGIKVHDCVISCRWVGRLIFKPVSQAVFRGTPHTAQVVLSSFSTAGLRQFHTIVYLHGGGGSTSEW